MKSAPAEIRQRSDNDVDRFINPETGQPATIDAPLVLELISSAAAATCPSARSALDVGCGAGNYRKLLEKLPGLDAKLVDLSRPMLDRALQRVAGAITAQITAMQGDTRELPLEDGSFDIIPAANSAVQSASFFRATSSIQILRQFRLRYNPFHQRTAS